MLDEPTGWELPPKGFEVKDDGYLAPEDDGSGVVINVSPSRSNDFFSSRNRNHQGIKPLAIQKHLHKS